MERTYAMDHDHDGGALNIRHLEEPQSAGAESTCILLAIYCLYHSSVFV